MLESKSTIMKNTFRNTNGSSYSLDPDQADPGPNCLQRLAADNTRHTFEVFTVYVLKFLRYLGKCSKKN